MNLLNKLSLGMAKIGCAGLRNASEYNKNNLAYVKAVVKAQGPRSFQFASDYIRSDSKSILEVVPVNSSILEFTKDKIFDRYYKQDNLIEKETDYLLFAFKCIEIDKNSILYFDEELQDEIIQTLKTKDFVVGEYEGYKTVVDIEVIKNSKEMLDLVEWIGFKRKSQI